MTDTTDSKALRVEIAELRLEIAKGYDRFIPETKIHIKLLERILDKLEAERQRAEGSEEELHKSLHREKAAERKLLAAQEELAALKPNMLVMPDDLHPDTKALVLVFASAMAVKLHKAEKKYGYDNSWKKDNWQSECQLALLNHVTKGDPLDVAAYCAFAWHHGWPTAPKTTVKGA